MPEDVLEFTMPAIVRFVTAEEADGGIDAATSYSCRVSQNGNITLPIVGDIKVSGKSLSRIESDIVDAYYPGYVMTRPSVFARVLEYKTARVSVTGAVQKPGIYALRSDQMSLVALLMEAGGIVDEGAAVIRIVRRNQAVLHREDAVPETHEETLEHSTELDAAAQLRAASYPYDGQIDIELSFRESAALNTAGKLSIRHGGSLLFAEHVNIADPGERQLLLSKLKRTEPRISATEVDEKLCMLASLLENEEQSPWLPAKPAQYHHAKLSRRSVDLDESEYSSGAASASYLASDMSADEAFDEKAIEIIMRDRSPRNARITGSGENQKHQVIVLPVKGINIPFANCELNDGDSVIVERLQLPLFSVVGLVKNPGNFPYPPDAEYNLMQALAFAGGLDRATEPRYATIYRRKHDGTIVSVVFQVVSVENGSGLTDALKTEIKPGDIIAVEHTPRTRTKQFLDTVFRINVGTYWRLNDAWED